VGKWVIGVANNETILSDRFEVVGEVAMDDRNRISLTKALESIKGLFQNTEGLRFSVHVNEVGQLLLSPVVSVPLYEAWLYKNPPALAKVGRGLSEAAKEELEDLGSFDKYADDEVE
jgi:hypothetical protein